MVGGLGRDLSWSNKGHCWELDTGSESEDDSPEEYKTWVNETDIVAQAER